MEGSKNTGIDALLKENENFFYGYFQSKGDLIRKLIETAEENDGRFIVNLDDVRSYSPDVPKRIITQPAAFIEPCVDAIKRIAMDNAIDITPGLTINVGFEGSFGRHHMTPRGLKSHLIGQLVMVEGIVTRMSLLTSQLQRSVSYADTTNEFVVRSHPNPFRITKRAQTGTSIIPSTTENGEALKPEYGYCTYSDVQRITLQEVPERAPTGQLPCSIDIVLQGDLVDRCKPGDRIVVVGTYSTQVQRAGLSCTGQSRLYLVANHVRRLKEHITSPHISDVELSAIESIAKREDAFEFLSRSFAPSIYGHDEIKKGLLLMLLGGQEKTLENGTHLRGDCHVMMVGDPSCGKSQLLRFVMNAAPLAISTTGRGTSGVGLTAAVTVDKDSNQRTLEAGAMVLADRGIVCIDEFDKMSVADRVAIHEAMEQQTVTIAKAGIYAELHARCTVVAAANPRFGNLDPTVKLRDQIDFPDSLLSRFDLIYVVRDLMDPEIDRRIAQFVLSRNVNMATGESSSANALSAMITNELTALIDVDDSELRQEERERLLRDAALNNGGNSDSLLFEKLNGKTEIAKLAFLRKYIYYAKHKHTAPTLSDESVARIAKIYTNLRSEMKKLGGGLTTRALEGLIRLSTAHARLKLHSQVEVSDVMAAQRLMVFCLFDKLEGFDEDSDVEESDFASDDEDENMDDGDESENEQPKKQQKGKKTPTAAAKNVASSATEHDAADDVAASDQGASQVNKRKRKIASDDEETEQTPQAAVATAVAATAAEQDESKRKRAKTVESSSIVDTLTFAVDSKEYQIAYQQIIELFDETGSQEFPLETLRSKLIKTFKTTHPALIGADNAQLEEAVQRALQALQDDNVCLVDGDVIYMSMC